MAVTEQPINKNLTSTSLPQVAVHAARLEAFQALPDNPHDQLAETVAENATAAQVGISIDLTINTIVCRSAC
jgi:hypothetical protein